MKKFLAIAMAAGMLICSMAAAVSAAPGKGSYGEVPLYKGGITVDGEMDEAYSLGLKIDASHDYADAYATETTADLYLLHDGEYLYLLYDVKSEFDIDPTKYNPDNATPASCWKGTGTELYFDWANDQTMVKLDGWVDGRYWGTHAADSNEAQYVADYKTTYDVEAKTYKMEWKLPMQGVATGSEVGFYVMVTSNKDMFSGAQDTICTTTPGLANNVAEFLNITISGTEVKMPEPVVEDIPTAPQTFDAGVIAAVSAVIAAAGVVVSKKKH